MPKSSLNTRISTLAAIGAAWFGIIQVLPAHAESCYPQFCVTPTVTRIGSGWNVHLKVRLTNYHYNEAHLKINGGSQIDLSSRTNVIDTDFGVNEEGPANFSIQTCQFDAKNDPFPTHDCNPWVALHAPLPFPCTSGYVWRDAFEYDYKCVVPDARYRLDNRNCKAGYVWRDLKDGDKVCVTPYDKSAAWVAAGKPLPGSTTGPGGGFIQMFPATSAPIETTSKDVDIYKDAGGSGKPIGVLRSGKGGKLLQKAADGWCKLDGLPADPGPPNFAGGPGWVWLGDICKP